MKRLLLIPLALAVGGVVWAQSLPANVIAKTLQPPFAAPSSASDGIDLSGAESWQVAMSADGGKLLSGAGAALCYYQTPVNSAAGAVTFRWVRCDSAFNLASTYGVRDVSSPQYVTPVGAGRLYFLPDSVGTMLPDAGGVADGGVSLTITVRRRP
jgi:hypothetical protein